LSVPPGGKSAQKVGDVETTAPVLSVQLTNERPPVDVLVAVSLAEFWPAGGTVKSAVVTDWFVGSPDLGVPVQPAAEKRV